MKKPFYEPFEDTDSMLLFDNGCGFDDGPDIEDMDPEELEVALEMHNDDIAEAETIISIELKCNNTDLESLRDVRRRKQQLKAQKELIKEKLKSKTFYAPFDRSEGQFAGLGLLFDPDTSCPPPQTVSRKDLENASLLDLELIAKDLQERIEDWETIIDIQIDECKRNGASSESLTNDRRHRQQLEAELHEVKKKIRMMKKELKEAAVA